MTRRVAPGLSRYAARRDFTRTPEPTPARVRVGTASGPVFAVQMHAARRLHYDLRLEHAGALLSWAVPHGLSSVPGERRLAMRTEDHPLRYADFEGAIPAGEYGAGAMMIWDRGGLRWLTDPGAGLASGKLEVALEGERLRGVWHLVRIKPRPGTHGEPWLVIRARDQTGDAGVAGEPAAVSIVTGRTLAEIAARAPETSGRLPAFRPPMLATLAAAPPSGSAWLHEIKYDGYRLQIAADADLVRIFTRAGLDWTTRFSPLAAAVAKLGLDRALLDGEAVVVDAAGRTSFSALQAALRDRGGRGVAFFAFDCLALAGEDLTSAPLTRRKARLRDALAGAPASGPIYFSDHVDGDGATMLARLCARGLEGVVSKRADAPYVSGRSPAWVKAKCVDRRELVVGGATRSATGRPFASLLVGEWSDDGLIYRGRIGAGFDAGALAEIGARLDGLRRSTSPFADLRADIARRAVFAEPELVIEARLTELTAQGVVRHGVFIALREDKPAREVRMARDDPPSAKQSAARPPIRLTHPDKVLFPESGLTKRALAAYLEAVAPRMAPFVVNRPISLVRCPEGRGKACFFQKHASAGFPDAFGAVEIIESDGARARYLTAPGPDAIVACAQIGALELHIWGARIDALDKPDRLVIDLDPDEALPFATVRAAAKDVRDLLQHAGLTTFPLLTGGKGVHVVAPLARRQTWPVVAAFAEGLARTIEAHAPDRFTATMSKAKRRGKIYVDHLRNRRGATAIAPYSPRARPGAPVAAPVTWADLDTTTGAAAFDTVRLQARLAAPDPWAGYAEIRQSLSRAAFRALGLSAPPRN